MFATDGGLVDLTSSFVPREASLPVDSDTEAIFDDDAYVSDLRARLLAANVLMRYDYAWKEVEFNQAASRLTGVASRLLYQYAMWRHAAALHSNSSASIALLPLPPHRVLIEANGFDAFYDDVARACRLMHATVVERTQIDTADLVIAFIAPPSDARVDNQFAPLDALIASSATSPDERPLLCLLLGDAALLSPPVDDDAERARGLSAFALGQMLHPQLQAAAYTSIAHFAVEFVQSTAVERAGPAAATPPATRLPSLMRGFGCVEHNLMAQTEAWQVFAPAASALALSSSSNNDDKEAENEENDWTQPTASESRYWLEIAAARACGYCYKPTDRLSTCAKCHSARYCSRVCQKAAWRVHKRVCGKTPEEIVA